MYETSPLMHPQNSLLPARNPHRLQLQNVTEPQPNPLMNTPARSLRIGNRNFFGFWILGFGISASGAPDPNWLDHDRDRPLPSVVQPAIPSTDEKAGIAPSDATVLFDGQVVSQWVSLDGSPTKWIV